MLCCSVAATLSGRRSFISTNCRDFALATSLAGMGGKLEASEKEEGRLAGGVATLVPEAPAPAANTADTEGVALEEGRCIVEPAPGKEVTAVGTGQGGIAEAVADGSNPTNDSGSEAGGMMSPSPGRPVNTT